MFSDHIICFIFFILLLLLAAKNSKEKKVINDLKNKHLWNAAIDAAIRRVKLTSILCDFDKIECVDRLSKLKKIVKP